MVCWGCQKRSTSTRRRVVFAFLNKTMSSSVSWQSSHEMMETQKFNPQFNFWLDTEILTSFNTTSCPVTIFLSKQKIRCLQDICMLLQIDMFGMEADAEYQWKTILQSVFRTVTVFWLGGMAITNRENAWAKNGVTTCYCKCMHDHERHLDKLRKSQTRVAMVENLSKFVTFFATDGIHYLLGIAFLE